VGRNVLAATINPKTGREELRKARILAADQGVVLQIGKGKETRIETHFPGRIIFPDVPADLRDRPTLTMMGETKAAGPRECSLTYLTQGLSWEANYVAELSDDDTTVDLSGWVTLTNESGTSFAKARLQLVAGDVNRVPAKIPRTRGAEMEAVLAAVPSMRAGGTVRLPSLQPGSACRHSK